MKLFFDAITTKDHNLTGEEIKRNFSPYVACAMLSQYRDCTLIVNELNLNSKYLDKQAQFEYLFEMIPKKRRRMVGIKKKRNDDLRVVTEWYKISDQKAEEYLRILPPQEIERMRTTLDGTGRHEY